MNCPRIDITTTPYVARFNMCKTRKIYIYSMRKCVKTDKAYKNKVRPGKKNNKLLKDFPNIYMRIVLMMLNEHQYDCP